MSTTLAGHYMVSTETSHTAWLLNPARDFWTVSWYPDSVLTRAEAVTALLLAELVARFPGVSYMDYSRRQAALFERWADELGLTEGAAFGLLNPIVLESFGYLHSEAPAADIVVDVRDTLRDPAAAREILDLTGHQRRVQDIVYGTPGAPELLDDLAAAATVPHGTPRPGRIAIGCAGGRHRSVALVELLATRLRQHYLAVTVTHHHVHLPRVIKQQVKR